ncbi:TolC family protein [Alteromonas pelagimontana]|uniref:TolC family protein n=1 Tax=Alteromonas pelagimontana TaxID=1858656 RepID=A0A6M4M8V0_9ALTE|nr:TolC family protein [Alteromonas pelagimontana]QJR79409.1 TolC family protein [Alteromonas pelagimontana]
MNNTRRHPRVCSRQVVVICSLVLCSTQSLSEPLTLKQATQLTLQQHPQLQKFIPLVRALEGEKEQASLSPVYEIGIQAENLMGSGNTAGFSESELTVSLSSVYELGDKLDARVALADAKLSLLQSEQYVQSLSLLGDLTEQYVRTLAHQERVKLAKLSLSLAQDALEIVKDRVEAGATNEAELLRANATFNQAKLDSASAEMLLVIAKQSLALFWREEGANLDMISGSLSSLPSSQQFRLLYQRFLASPNMERLSNAIDAKDAELALAHSNTSADISWSVGIKRLQDVQDTSIVAGVSLPLFAGKRNRGAEKAATARKMATTLDRDSKLLEVKRLLFEASHYLNFTVQAVSHLNKSIIPDLQQAMKLTLEGYEQGIYNYQEWLTSREALIRTQARVIDLSETALIHQALIEQWTGLPSHALSSHRVPE